MTASTPSLTGLRVVPVAGRDSMLLNLSGAHGPFFTRNLLILPTRRTASSSCRARAYQNAPDALELVVGSRSARTRAAAYCREVRRRDSGGRGQHTSTCDDIHAVTSIESAARLLATPRCAVAALSAGHIATSQMLATFSTWAQGKTDFPTPATPTRRHWLRLRHEEALTPVCFACEAAHALYGFNDFKLKGAPCAAMNVERFALPSASEARVTSIQAALLKTHPPDSRHPALAPMPKDPSAPKGLLRSAR